MNKKVALYTLGCKLNFSETSTIARNFEQRGFKRVGFTDRADVYVINTCSVTDNADKKCKKVVKEARRFSPDAYIVIIGCYAQLKPKEIAKIEGVDAVLGAAEKFQLIDLLDGFVRQKEARVIASEIKEANAFVGGYSINDRTRTFLKVQDGCNYNCAFCTIPLARGKSRSSTVEAVLKHAQEIAATDVKEVVLTGVNLGDFGIVEGKRQFKFFDLIKELDKVGGIERFRISSIEPNLLTDEIIDFVAHSKRFVPHFHIPLQSGADAILESMRRRYRKQLYADRIAHIKAKMPHCCIGVDVITGFPGETEELFMETYQFLNELDVSYLHVFTYSERANTAAVAMGNVVPMKTRNQRSKMLRGLSHKKKRIFYEQNIGKTATVLFEHDVQNNVMEGFTENYVRVRALYDPLKTNTLQQVELLQINQEGLVDINILENSVLKIQS